MGISVIGGATGGGGTVKERAFLTSGTWTVPDGVESVEATVVGAAGGNTGGLGSGAGGYWKGVVPTTPGATMPVTVAAGASGANVGGYSEFGPIRAMGSPPASGNNGTTGAVMQVAATAEPLGGGILSVGAVSEVASSTEYDTNRMPVTAGAYTIWVSSSYQSNTSRFTKLWDGPNSRFINLQLDNLDLGPYMFGNRFFYFEQTAPNHLFFLNGYGAAYDSWGVISIADINATPDGGTLVMYGATASGFYLPEISQQPNYPISFREVDGKLWLFYRDNIDGIWYSSDITVSNNWNQITNTDLGTSTTYYPFALEVDDAGAWWVLSATHWNTTDTYYMSVSYDNGATWSANNATTNDPGIGDYNYYYPNYHPQHQFRYLNSRTDGTNTYQRFLVYTGYATNTYNYFFHKVNVIEWSYNTASPGTPTHSQIQGSYINGVAGLGTSSDNLSNNGYRQYARTDIVNGRVLLSMTHHEIGATVDITDALPAAGATYSAVSTSLMTVKLFIDDDNSGQLYQSATYPDPVNNYVYHSAYANNTNIKISAVYSFSKPAITGAMNSNVPATSGAGGPGVSGTSTTYGYGYPGPPAADGFAGGSNYAMPSSYINRLPGWGLPPSASTSEVSANGIVVLRWSE